MLKRKIRTGGRTSLGMTGWAATAHEMIAMSTVMNTDLTQGRSQRLAMRV